MRIQVVVLSYLLLTRLLLITLCFEDHLLSDGLPLECGRRFLRDLEIKETKKSVFKTKFMAMAVPGILIMCCSCLCPCFRSKRKDTDGAVLVKESNSYKDMLVDENALENFERTNCVLLHGEDILHNKNNKIPMLLEQGMVEIRCRRSISHTSTALPKVAKETASE